MSIKWDYDTFNRGTDAYLDWALGPGGRFFPGFVEYEVPASLTEYLLPLVLEFTDSQALGNFVRGFQSLIASDLAGALLPKYFPVLHDNQTVLPMFLPSAIAKKFIEPLDEDMSEFLSTIVRIIPGRPIPADALCCKNSGVDGAIGPQQQSIAGNTNKSKANTVIIGIIDEGLAFANERFRDGPTDTRVEYAWMQDAKCEDPVEGFYYGKELKKPEIDDLLSQCLRGGQVDEDKFYALAGLADYSRTGHKAVSWRLAHGTHVMDLAAGYPQGTLPEDVNWHIISVQLPTSTVAETSGLGLEKFLLDGINYIFDRASKIAEDYEFAEGTPKELPLVINFSSGVRAGPHDGSSLIEKYLDQRIEARRCKATTQIVLPAGNSYLERSHAKFQLKPSGKSGSTQRIEWFIPPDDRTFSYVEI